MSGAASAVAAATDAVELRRPHPHADNRNAAAVQAPAEAATAGRTAAAAAVTARRRTVAATAARAVATRARDTAAAAVATAVAAVVHQVVIAMTGDANPVTTVKESEHEAAAATVASTRRGVEARATTAVATGRGQKIANAATRRRDDKIARSRRTAKMNGARARRHRRLRAVAEVTMRMTTGEVAVVEGASAKDSAIETTRGARARNPSNGESHEREEVNESKRSAAATEINSEQESKSSEQPAEDASSARVNLPSLASLSSTAASRQRSSDETANSKPTAVSFTSTLVRQGRSRGSSDVGESAAISISTSGNSRSGTPHQHSGAKSGSTPVARPSPAASSLAPEAKSNGPYASTALPLLDPAMEKLRETRRESWRAHLKSTSEFNRAEMKMLALEADLEIAEFWLEMMTANLEDVGKRIEIHDWNYQKAREQQELE